MSVTLQPQFGRRATDLPVMLLRTPATEIGATASTVPPVPAINEIRTLCLSRLDPAAVAGMSPERLLSDMERMISEIATQNRLQLNAREQRGLATELVHDIVGLGPLEPLLADDTISDIMINGPNRVFVERRGKTVLVGGPFPRHPASGRHLPAHRRRGWPPGRRIQPHGRRPLAGRLPRQHRLPAIGAGRPLRFHPQIRQEAD